MTSVNPGRWVDAASITTILNPVEVIWTILLVQVADSMEKLVVDTANIEAPVWKTKCLPAGLDIRLAIGAARANSNPRPAALSSRKLAGYVNTDVVAEIRIVDELDAAHRQGEVDKLVVNLLPVLGGNSILDSVRDDVSSFKGFAAYK